MSDASELGVLYTEHAALASPFASLWSYESRTRESGRPTVRLNPAGSREYWLHRSDPLLNTVLPGTHVSVVVNLGDLWAAGRTLPTSELVPRVCVMGPFTQPRLLRVGRSVRAVGVVFPSTQSTTVLGVPASELVDRIVSLEEFWGPSEVEQLLESLSCLEAERGAVAVRNRVLAQSGATAAESLEDRVSHLIHRRAGRVAVEDLARRHGLSRQLLARRFRAATGLAPKAFARVTRFQQLVYVLLSTDVSEWASASPAVGFFDQAHMVNEFRTFAGAPPTVFFRPHDITIDPARIEVKGRPSEWLRIEAQPR